MTTNLSERRRAIFNHLYGCHVDDLYASKEFEKDILEEGGLEDDGRGTLELPVFLENGDGDSIKTSFKVRFHKDSDVPVECQGLDGNPYGKFESFPVRSGTTGPTNLAQSIDNLSALTRRLSVLMETRRQPFEHDILDILQMAQTVAALSGIENVDDKLAELNKKEGVLGGSTVEAVIL